ncbi:hypothetical protein JL720_14606 [Aureococcus anophagefferens]|nr:hypothetical protein JL720_14606 [Aureococcus anophagefferens]
MDAIASIFVNYHEERRELVEKTEAADLIEQNLLIQFVVLPRKMGTGRDSLEAPVRLRPHALPPPRREGRFLFATEAGAPAWLTLGFEHVGSSASLIHLRFDLLFKRDRGVLALRPRSRDAAAAARWTALKIFSDSAGLYPMERVAEYGEKQVVRLAKEAANAAARPRPNDDEVRPRLDGRAGAGPARGAVAAARLVGPGAGGAVAVGARGRASSPPRGAAAPSPEAAGPRGRAAGAGAAPPRHRVKRVVDDADADDEDEAWEPGRPSMMDLDDDEQEQAAKAKRKLKRRSKKKSAKAKNAAGAAPHAPVSAPPAPRRRAARASTTIAPATQPVPAPAAAAAPPPRPLPKIRVFPQLSEVQKARLRMKDQEHIRRAARLHEAVTQEQERNAFLERIQAEEVRREQARIAAARPVPPPPNRDRRGDDSDEGWEESDEDDPVEDLIHRERIRERDCGRPAASPSAARPSASRTCRATERDREILRRVLYILREAERRNCGELEVPRPREWANSELGDTMTTEAIRARFDLRRDDGVFLRLQRLFPNHDFRLSWSVRFNVVVQTIDAIALDSNLELTRRHGGPPLHGRRLRDSLACQLLGQTYYVHPDKTIKITVDLVVTSEVIGAFASRRPSFHAREIVSLAGTAPGRAEVHIKELGFHFVDPLAPIAEKEIAEGDYQLALSNYRQQELWCSQSSTWSCSRAAAAIRKFANAIARKAAEARGETFVPTPYDETAVDAVVVTAVPPVAPVVSAPAGPPLKALEAMSRKELEAELDAAGVPKKGRGRNATVDRDLVRRLRAGEPAASLKVPRKPKSAEELFCLDKAEQLACRARTPRPSTSIFHARTLSSSQATLVADGAKKVVFKYVGAKKGSANGTDYLVARWRGLAETDPLRLEFDELARDASSRRPPTSCPWTGSSARPTPAS